MHPLTSEVLSRFHRALVEEIQRSRPDYLTGAFTVAEIYQNLVPYRSHRDQIGVEMNGDYEDALLRLLAGEGDYLVLESDHARKELREELESSNPNTGLFREFAAADVRLNQARLPASVAWDGGGEVGPPHDAIEELPDVAEVDEPPDFAMPDAGEGAPRGVSPDDLFGDSVTFDMSEGEPIPVEAPAPPGVDDVRSDAGRQSRHGAPGVTRPDPSPAACRWCREPLPRRANLNYCPFCGANARHVPCPNCGEELEADWRFCVACGTEAQEGG